MQVCSFPECGRRARGAGLCEAHRRQVLRGGELRPIKKFATTKQPVPLEKRFWSKVKKGAGCWEWTGSVNGGGYGLIFVRASENARRVAHGLAWEITNGPVPEGMFVLHKCDNPPCVRPDHLFLGTHQDNMNDAASKGRMSNNKLTDDDVRRIREAHQYGVLSMVELGRAFRVRRSYIDDIVTRRARRRVA